MTAEAERLEPAGRGVAAPDVAAPGVAAPGVAAPGVAAAAGVGTLRQLRSLGRVRGIGALLGPAFVAAVAYVDPGNFATNFSAGARFGYTLAWVVVLANLMAML